MTVTLLMLWCLAGACEEVPAPVSITMAECTIWGQIHARRWQAENPAYSEHTFAGWRCENGVRAELEKPATLAQSCGFVENSCRRRG